LAELRIAYLLSEDDRTWLEALDWPLHEEEKLALVFAPHEGWIDNGTLRRVTDQHPTDVTRMLGKLRDDGLLQMIGGGRGAKYRLDPSVVVFINDINVAAKAPGAQLNVECARFTPKLCRICAKLYRLRGEHCWPSTHID
jgi:hypothetical protein